MIGDTGRQPCRLPGDDLEHSVRLLGRVQVGRLFVDPDINADVYVLVRSDLRGVTKPDPPPRLLAQLRSFPARYVGGPQTTTKVTKSL